MASGEDDEQSFHTKQVRRGDRVVALRRGYLRLVVKAGPDKGLRHRSAVERIVVGTHPSCDVVLSDPTISRQHCEITLERRGYRVRDLDSTNGITYERVRVRDVLVSSEIELHLGDTRVVLTPLDESVEVPLAADASFGPLLGQSASMRRVFHQLERLATTDTTVLLTGESGTGKEVAAQALHEASARRAGPFQVVDCGALSPTLVESELYGHERGAFTGADRARKGAFEAAAGGTLFLDELGELQLPLQSRLLRVLERREVQPLGSQRRVPIDVRIVAATNRDLRREVNRGTFREDLFFRVAVASVHLPPLRDRPEDIALYVDKFVEGRGRIDAPTLERLKRERWPGNVRELRNALEHAMALGEPVEVPRPRELEALHVDVDPTVPFKTAKALLLERYERLHLASLIEAHGGNISHAARTAEMDRVHFVRLLDRYGIRPTRRG